MTRSELVADRELSVDSRLDAGCKPADVEDVESLCTVTESVSDPLVEVRLLTRPPLAVGVVAVLLEPAMVIEVPVT